MRLPYHATIPRPAGPSARTRARYRARPLAALSLAGLLLSTLVGASPVLGAEPVEGVTPDLVPKAELPLAPADEVNVSVAPAVPPPSGRTTLAIVEVEFEVVEQVTAIDPASGVEYETWGYRIPGDDAVSGTPGPMIRARVGDILRFTIHNPEDASMPHNVDFHAVTGRAAAPPTRPWRLA